MTASNSIWEFPGSARKRSFSRPVGPERRVHRIGDEPRSGPDVLGRVEQARLAELAREWLRPGLRGCFDQPVESAAGEVHEIDLARLVLGEFDDPDLGVGQLMVVDHLAPSTLSDQTLPAS